MPDQSFYIKCLGEDMCAGAFESVCRVCVMHGVSLCWCSVPNTNAVRADLRSVVFGSYESYMNMCAHQ